MKKMQSSQTKTMLRLAQRHLTQKFQSPSLHQTGQCCHSCYRCLCDFCSLPLAQNWLRFLSRYVLFICMHCRYVLRMKVACYAGNRTRIQQKHKYRKKTTAKAYHPKQGKFLVSRFVCSSCLSPMSNRNLCCFCMQDWADLNNKDCKVTSEIAFEYLSLFTRNVSTLTLHLCLSLLNAHVFSRTSAVAGGHMAHGRVPLESSAGLAANSESCRRWAASQH